MSAILRMATFLALASLGLTRDAAPQNRDMVNGFLERKVKAAAALAAPASREEFDRRRADQRRELYRSLGLDPLPPRTPLNARTAGLIERPGYRIEKVVFDSRPDFPVTAHLYVPAGPAGGNFRSSSILTATGDTRRTNRPSSPA